MNTHRALAVSGPKTPEGKTRSSRNSTGHGLRANVLVMPQFETEADWVACSDGIVDSLAPDGGTEVALAARVAELLWRLRRIARAEVQMVESAFEATHTKDARQRQTRVDAAEQLAGSFYGGGFEQESGTSPAPTERRLLPADGDLDQLIRYEAHLNRQLYHALHELEALQARRNGSSPPLARIQVHGLPGS